MPEQAGIRSILLALAAAAVVAGGPPGLAQSEHGRVPGGADWAFIGGDWANSRYSTLDAIDTRNVGRLGAAWSLAFDGGASTRATPVAAGGVLSIGSGTRLYAIDGATGESLGTVRPDEEAPADLEAAGIGDILNAGRAIPSPPGVAVGGGKVFIGLMDGRVAAVQSGYVRMEQPGTFTCHCEDHPWAMGQIQVEP